MSSNYNDYRDTLFLFKDFFFQVTLEMNILLGVTLEMNILQLNILRRKMSRTPVVISR